MRRRALRRSMLRRAALAVPAVVAPALGAGLADAASAPARSGASTSSDSIKMTVKQTWIDYGHHVTVTGHAPSGEQGKWVDLDFAPAGSSSWHQIAAARVGASDRFHLQARLRHTGRVAAVGTWGPSSSGTSGSGTSTSGGTTVPPPAGSSPAPAGDNSRNGHPASQPQRIVVRAEFRMHPRTVDDLGGHTITLQGKLLPANAGDRVRLQARSGGGWHTVAHAHTGDHGRFYLHYRPGSRPERLRVRFPGDRFNAAVAAPAGRVTVFTQAMASWYNDAGNTACGFHATYGVADLSLPCGTHVTFLYHGHSVTATVDDRGPYVSGREWDLNQNTAARLGFNGLDDVWASR
jgi:hypothetical protein